MHVPDVPVRVGDGLGAPGVDLAEALLEAGLRREVVRVVVVEGDLVPLVPLRHDGHAEVVRLLLREGRELNAKFREVKTRDLFVEFFGQKVHAERILLRFRPQRDLRQDLIRKRIRHDKRRMPRRATKINESTFGEK